MEDFVYQLIGYFPSFLQGPARSVADRILAPWHASTDFWGRLRSEYQRLRNIAFGRIGAQLRHLYSLAVTLRWIITVYVPRQAGIFAEAVRQEARALWNQAVTTARAELGAVRDWLIQQLNAVANALNQWAHWVAGNLDSLLADARMLKDRVFGVLGTPERLAAWAIGAIMNAAAEWLVDNAVRLGRRLLAARAKVLLDSLGMIEDIVTRIL